MARPYIYPDPSSCIRPLGPQRVPSLIVWIQDNIGVAFLIINLQLFISLVFAGLMEFTWDSPSLRHTALLRIIRRCCRSLTITAVCTEMRSCRTARLVSCGRISITTIQNRSMMRACGPPVSAFPRITLAPCN